MEWLDDKFIKKNEFILNDQKLRNAAYSFLEESLDQRPGKSKNKLKYDYLNRYQS